VAIGTGDPHGEATRRKGAAAAALAQAVSQFGHEVAEPLRLGVGGPEDQLRGPFERLLTALGQDHGLRVTLHGETRLPTIEARPDFAVDVDGIRVGYVELKAPGYGVPTRWRRHDKRNDEQWVKLKALPNVLYGDGQEWALFHYGECVVFAAFKGELKRAGRLLSPADNRFSQLITTFLTHKPIRERTLREVVRIAAGLCDLLRDEVSAALIFEASNSRHTPTYSSLAGEWRQLLFPRLTDAEFSDAYAQTVTFALLLARAEGVAFEGNHLSEIARLLGKKHSLMGKALSVLTEEPTGSGSIAVDALLRVLGPVEWNDFRGREEENYQQLYERFLTRYDSDLRRRTGSYYTPRAIVSFMVNFVDEILRTRLGMPNGFADQGVLVADPAMGTGTYLAEIINKVAATVAAEEDPNMVPARLRDLVPRLIGLEKQVAPYAVAEFQVQEALRAHGADVPHEDVRFLNDTLDDPDARQLTFGSFYRIIEENRNGANRVKRATPIVVVIGNPPYAERAKGMAPWIEKRGSAGALRPSLDAFRAPGNGRLEYVLSNLSVYFWRWATWKVFDAHPDRPSGVVAFISTSAYLASPGFAGMREYLRHTADEGWIIDLSPEGHRSDVKSRVFPGVQHPLCIGIFVRSGDLDAANPAVVRLATVGGKQGEKFAALADLHSTSSEWKECESGWQDPFRPPTRPELRNWPTLSDLMPWSGPGVKPNRTWVYAPDQGSLNLRWELLVGARQEEKSRLFKESRDSNLQRIPPALPGQQVRNYPFQDERGSCPEPVRVAPRSFDRQWMIPDSRLYDGPRPNLWRAASERQVFVTEQHAHPINGGPALTFTAALPDMHHYNGRGGRVRPLYLGSADGEENLTPGLLSYLSQRLEIQVNADDFLAYVAAVSAHPGYVKHFGAPVTGGIQIPLTADTALWRAALDSGYTILWLHTFGERYADPLRGRPERIPRLSADRRPRIISAIPHNLIDRPESFRFDDATRTLYVGNGAVAPIDPRVWSYEVAGMHVLGKWLGYRMRRRAGRRSSPLDDVWAGGWSATMTAELLTLVTVLTKCVDLEEVQDTLLGAITAGPSISIIDLRKQGILPVRRPAVGPVQPQAGTLPLY